MRIYVHVVQGRKPPVTQAFEAESVAEALRSAEEQGYTVLGHRRPLTMRGVLGPMGHARHHRLDVTLLLEQLRDLLNAGLSVVEALDTMERGATPGMRAAISQARLALQRGMALSDAVATLPGAPGMLIALLRASEHTSDLQQTLTQYLEHDRKVNDVRHRLVSMLVYPATVTTVGLSVTLFLLFYVMPRFARIFDGMTGELPWSATLMVTWAHWLDAASWTGFAAIGWVLLALALSAMSAAWRARMLQVLLWWRPLREGLRLHHLCRWYRTTGMLVSHGIALSQALALTRDVLPMTMRDEAQVLASAVNAGLPPSQAFQKAGLSTPVAQSLLRASERGGGLGAGLSRIAEFHETQLSRTLERVMKTLEPLVMVVVGLAIGLIVVLMYLPVFELAAAIQ